MLCDWLVAVRELNSNQVFATIGAIQNNLLFAGFRYSFNALVRHLHKDCSWFVEESKNGTLHGAVTIPNASEINSFNGRCNSWILPPNLDSGIIPS